MSPEESLAGLKLALGPFARIVLEESGSITATQDTLGHRNLATTRVYVERIGIKRDQFSRAVRERIGR